MAEMALEIQIERLRVTEITKARDAALQRLSDAYVSIRQKTKVIDQLQQERDVKGLAPFPINLSSLEERTEIDSLKAHIVNLESIVEELRSTVRRLQRQLPIGCQPLDPASLSGGCPQGESAPLLLNSKGSLLFSRPQQTSLFKRMRPLLLPVVLLFLPQSQPSQVMIILP
jgi:hypothetical protein